MTAFADEVLFEIEHCYKCHVAFAVPAEFRQKRLRDHETFYCPAGHGQQYLGQTPEQKLRDALARAQQMRDAAEAKAATAEADRISVTKAHDRMRKRVMNGVCPCCNRSFDNLRRHMQSEHADFGATRTLQALRQAFGMTQADVAREASVNQATVSAYEREKPVGSRAVARLEQWVAEHQGKAP